MAATRFAMLTLANRLRATLLTAKHPLERVPPLSLTICASAQTNPDLNHAVQLVGYGTDPKDGDYWLVRNSWSPVWGERGYIRLRREVK